MNVTITKTYTTRTGSRGIVGKIDGRSFSRFIRRDESPADAVLRVWGVRLGSKARRGLRFEDHFLREDGFTGALRVDREVKVIMNDRMKPVEIKPDADGIYRGLADGLYMVTTGPVASGGVERFFTVSDGHLDHLYRDQVKGWLKAQGWI